MGQPAVPKDIGALRLKLSKSGADTSRVKLLIGLSRYYNASTTKSPMLNDSAIFIALQAQKLSSTLSYPEGTGLSYQVMAMSWSNKKDFKKSDELIKKAIQIFLSHNLYIDAAEAYLNMEEFYLAAGGTDYNVMIGYYEQAKPLFIKGGAKMRAGATLNVLGDFYLQIGKNDEAIAALQSALSLYKSTGKKDLQSTYDLLGYNYLQITSFNEALKYALLAVKTAEEVQDTSMLLCTIYNRTGMVYYALSQFSQSTAYYKKSIAVARKYNDRSEIFLAGNLANNLLHENKSAEAIELLKQTELRFPDIGDEYLSRYNSSILQAYLNLKKYDEAKYYSTWLLKAYSKNKYPPISQANMLGPVIQYFIETKQYGQAANYFPEFMNTAKQLRGKPRFIQKGYLFAYQIDSANNNPVSALRNYTKYASLKDSISEATKNKQMQELQIQYETEKKEKENLVLRKESLLQANKAKQAGHIRDLTLIGTCFLLVFIVLLYYSYRVNQKNSKAISEKNDSLRQLVTEKEWLLKEIHHRVKNNLQIVMGLLQQQSAYINNDDALAAIQNSENRMRSIALIHQKLYQSDNLDLISMPEYTNEMITNLKDSCGLDNRIFFEKQVDNIYLDVAQAVPLGLIMNEAITNAIKYAYKADMQGVIYISLIKAPNQYIELTIADNGPGLPETFDIKKVESLGINLMRGLSKQLGGSFDITSEQGCMISISFQTEIFNRGITEAEVILT